MANQVPSASVREVPDARGFMRKLDDPETKKCRLYARVKGGKHVDSKLFESKNVKTEEAMKKVESLWDQAEPFLRRLGVAGRVKEVSLGRLAICTEEGLSLSQSSIYDKMKEMIVSAHPGAKHIAIDFKDGVVRFIQDGKRVEIKKEDTPQELQKVLEFLDNWQELHDLAMQVMGIRSWHTTLGIDQSRSSSGERLFELESSALQSFMPKSPNEFMQSHLTSLLEKLPEERRGKARKKIEDTVSFIEIYKEKISQKIKEAEEKEAIYLKKIEEQIEKINYYALFWAIAFTADLSSEEASDPKILSQRAQQLGSGMLQVFKETRSISPEKSSLAWWRGKPTEDDLKVFVAQAQGLLFHSDIDYLAHFDTSGEKKIAAAGIEEFVVHNMLYLGEEGYEDDLRSLGLANTSPEKQETMRSLIKGAHQSVSASRGS